MVPGSAPRRQSVSKKVGSSPRRFAISLQSEANQPVRGISTASPGESVLTSAASHAPVPEAGKITTGPLVWKTRLRPVRTERPSVAKSGPRWSIVGSEIARSTRPGTSVGPGICRKWRPGERVFIASTRVGEVVEEERRPRPREQSREAVRPPRRRLRDARRSASRIAIRQSEC